MNNTLYLTTMYYNSSKAGHYCVEFTWILGKRPKCSGAEAEF